MNTKLQQLAEHLRLRGLAGTLNRELAQAQKEGSPVEEVLWRLLCEELRYREEQSLTYRLQQARIPWDWTLETFPFDKQRSASKAQILSLADLSFIERAQNLVFIGEPGTGKTGLAIGLLRKALLNGHRGLFLKAQDLIDQLYASLADRSTPKLLQRLARYPLLVIDEIGYLTLKPEQSNAFFKLIDERYGKTATVLTTNLEYDDWYPLFQRKSLVDALLDRLRHHAITIRLKPPSLRTPDEQPSPQPA
jgi:DNA replication protein DnaC